MLAGDLGVGCDSSRRREVEIALEGKTERPARGSELVEAHVAELRFAEAKVAEAKGEMPADGVQLCKEPGGVAVGGKDLNDGFEVEDLVLAVEGVRWARPFSRSFWRWAEVIVISNLDKNLSRLSAETLPR